MIMDERIREVLRQVVDVEHDGTTYDWDADVENVKALMLRWLEDVVPDSVELFEPTDVQPQRDHNMHIGGFNRCQAEVFLNAKKSLGGTDEDRDRTR